MNIGDTISKLRKEKKLTQEELASKLNVSAKTISSWENNRNIPSIDMLILLSNELDTNIDTLLDLKNNNKLEKSLIYEKKTIKDKIIKTIIMGIIFIIPVLYFWYAGYITIAAYTAHLWAFDNPDLVKTAQIMQNLFTALVIEYFIYLIFMLINYILYIKKQSNILLSINTFILAFIALRNFDIAIIILIILLVTEISLNIIKNKKILFYFNIIVILISLIIYVITTIINNLVDLDYIIFVVACLIGIYWAMTRRKK